MDRSRLDHEQPPLSRDELVERCLGRIELVERVLEKFQTHFEGDLSELEAALGAADIVAVGRLAHRLKGAAANVAAPRLREKAEGIETLAARRCLAELPAHCAELRNEWSLFRDYLAACEAPEGTVA